MASGRTPHAVHVKWSSMLVLLAVVAVPAAVAQAPAAELELSADALTSLAERGFVVVAGGSDDFVDAYASLAERGHPPFVTADSVLRVTDLLIDRILRTIEDEHLYDRLGQLSRELVRLVETDYFRASDPLVKEASRRNLAFFAVGLSLLDPDYFPPESVRGLVERELELIEEADRTVMSPIMGQTPLDRVVGPGEDYTRYVPRGHYAESERLGRYYRALTWYSRMAFALPERPIEDYTLTMQALLIVRALESEAGEWFELWERIHDPVVFYKGGAGDPTVADYMEMADDVFGRDFERESVANESLLIEFVDRVAEVAPAHVQTHELRGMRFLPRDHPPVTDYFGLLAGSEDRPLPTSLDIMSLLGSTTARTLLDEEDVFDSSVYRQSYEDIRLSLERMTYGEWTRDLYWSWLYALSSLQRPAPGTAPPFAAERSWGYKELTTGGASWAAIRYQAADAPLTAGPAALDLAPGDVPAMVEPYPQLYARLRETLENLSDRLWEHYLLDDRTASALGDFGAFLTLLEEASGGGRSSSDPAAAALRLGRYSEILGRLVGQGRDLGTDEPGCVVLSDVAYVDVVTGRLLENAVGTPDLIYVRPSGDGPVYAGAVYSFYEMKRRDEREFAGAGWPAMLMACPQERPSWAGRYMEP